MPLQASARSLIARGAIMRAAERLYAADGFAGVSIRQIGEAAGQRNKSAVQYHFTGRDELVKAILAEHAEAMERHRVAMMSRLGEPGDMALEDKIRCVVLPHIEHHIDLGVPSWYGRFLGQVVVEPALREYAVRANLETPSLRRLYDATHWATQGQGEPDPCGRAQREAMTRVLIVHMCAELEGDLATGHTAEHAAASWRRLGEHLVMAVCGLLGALRADPRAL
ncbi:TetR/AcrR family transcriptional regulator [Nonomuraea sp. CA-141351]|uniref:TetR/AcrR family transcriptional regulator n=1 Tax=Nonomuraea sp. CA-141351 TaxID=3239996 RepID=UPI003D91D268